MEVWMGTEKVSGLQRKIGEHILNSGWSCYIYFHINTLGKSVNPSLSQSYGLNIRTGWVLWQPISERENSEFKG